MSMSGSLSSPEKVFLIDDNDNLRSDLARMLTSSGYTVEAFSSATEFLNKFKASGIAVIVSDMTMPGISGEELHKVLLSRNVLIPFVFISGESSDSQIISAMKNHPVDFLLKPFSLKYLISAVEKALEVARVANKTASQRLDFEKRFERLSPREQQVFHLLAKGFGNQELFTELNVSVHTAKQYKAEVMRKMGINTLSDLIALANNEE